MFLVNPFSLCICGHVREWGVFRALQQSKSTTATESYLPTKEGLASFSGGSNHSFSMANRLGELNTHLPKKKHILSQNDNDLKLYDTHNLKHLLSSNLAKITLHCSSSSSSSSNSYSSSRPNTTTTTNNNNNNNMYITHKLTISAQRKDIQNLKMHTMKVNLTTVADEAQYL